MRRHKIYTLEITKKPKRHISVVGTEEDVDVQADYDLTGFIYDIRVWSDFFGDFVSVNQLWLVKNLPSKTELIQQRVNAAVEEALFPNKEFNNDDITIA